MEDKCRVTLVRSRIKSRPYCKTDGKYLGPTWSNDIGLQTISNTPEAMFDLCSVLLDTPHTCMVMGTAIKPEIIDTDRTLKNFIEEPLSYVMLDLDKYEVENIRDKNYNQVVKEVDNFIKTQLPPEFQNTTYTLCFSSSFLIKKKILSKMPFNFYVRRPTVPTGSRHVD